MKASLGGGSAACPLKTWLALGVEGSDPCGSPAAWSGVSCTGGGVTWLDLSSCGFGGTLPSVLSSFVDLQV